MKKYINKLKNTEDIESYPPRILLTAVPTDPSKPLECTFTVEGTDMVGSFPLSVPPHLPTSLQSPKTTENGIKNKLDCFKYCLYFCRL